MAVLHGVQLWAARPAHARVTDPGFEHYTPSSLSLPGAKHSVFMGKAAGQRSPIDTFSPLVGTEIIFDAGASLVLDLAAGFVHGFLVVSGSRTLVAPTGAAPTIVVPAGAAPTGSIPARAAARKAVSPGELAYLGTGNDSVRVAAETAPLGRAAEVALPAGAADCSDGPLPAPLAPLLAPPTWCGSG